MQNSAGDRSTGTRPEDLIARIAESADKEAFAALFDEFAPRVKYFLVRQGTSMELAEELAQEALLIVWRKADYFARSRGTAASWIFAIARNLRIDTARRDKRAQLYAMTDEAESDREEPPRPDDIVSQAESAARVRAAMSDLPPEQLEVVRLSFIEGAPHSEIAERLDLPLGTVKSRLRLAMRRMRKSLEDLA
jgi:RNA polymerase sigma-70 factor (ECF subfamily)